MLADAEAGAEQDDARLVAAVARQDAAAFRILVDRHGPALWRLAYRILGDASEAEDVVQDSLLRLWDHAAGWRPIGGGLGGWLRRVATNLCFDRTRRRARLSGDEVPDRADDAPGADCRLDVDRRDRAARDALATLSDRQRAAIVLTYYEDLPNAAAAETMGLNVKAFESLLLRARATLRERAAAAGLTTADAGGIA